MGSQDPTETPHPPRTFKHTSLPLPPHLAAAERWGLVARKKGWRGLREHVVTSRLSGVVDKRSLQEYPELRGGGAQNAHLQLLYKNNKNASPSLVSPGRSSSLRSGWSSALCWGRRSPRAARAGAEARRGLPRCPAGGRRAPGGRSWSGFGRRSGEARPPPAPGAAARRSVLCLFVGRKLPHTRCL